MNVVDDADGPLDPRIQIELENLNTATDDINKLEIELDEAHTAYSQLLSESRRRCEELSNRLGANCIEKAKCYYEVSKIARQARIQCQQQAQLFRQASEHHAAAKETVAVAEKRFLSHQHEWNFDQAWQDMLNHATIKVTDAEIQKAECGREHLRKAKLCEDAEKKVQQLEEKYRRSIIKATPYLELKAHYDQMLATQVECIQILQNAVKDAKLSYSTSLRALEDISNQIHRRRKDYEMVASGPREPGVGAELINTTDIVTYEGTLKTPLSRMNSLASSETDTDDIDQDVEDMLELQQRVNLDGRAVDGSEATSPQWELELQASVEKLNSIPLRPKVCENIDSVDTSKSTSIEKQKENEPDLKKNEIISQPILTAKTLQMEPSSQHKQVDDNQSTVKSIINSSYYQGWQTLAQSPINSIFNRSKIALKNSLSKSLSSSPVNMSSFSFGKTRTATAHPPQITTNATPVRCRPESVEKESQPRKIIVPSTTRKHEQTLVENKSTAGHFKCADSPIDKSNTPNNLHHLSDKEVGTLQPQLTKSEEKQKRLLKNNTQVQKDFQVTHSLDSTPVRSKPVQTTVLTNSFDLARGLGAANLKKIDSSSTRAKELPLLSMIQEPSTLRDTKDKSCSMINLNEKQNLKTLLDSSDLGNIQAISIERLANARSHLFSEESSQGPSKK